MVVSKVGDRSKKHLCVIAEPNRMVQEWRSGAEICNHGMRMADREVKDLLLRKCAILRHPWLTFVAYAGITRELLSIAMPVLLR